MVNLDTDFALVMAENQALDPRPSPDAPARMAVYHQLTGCCAGAQPIDEGDITLDTDAVGPLAKSYM